MGGRAADGSSGSWWSGSSWCRAHWLSGEKDRLLTRPQTR